MSKKEIAKRKTILGIVLPTIVVLLVVAIVYYMNNVLNNSIYSERRELLTRISESCANVVDYDIEGGRKIQDMLVDAILYDLPEYESVSSYIEHTKTREDYISYPFFLVDSNGKYYASDGTMGKMVDTSYYTDSAAEEMLYISSLPHHSADNTYMIFRTRFSAPIKTKCNDSDVLITYCGILYDLQGINDTLSKQFGGRYNLFIYDEKGQMLYKTFGIKMLIEGYNVFSKIHKVEARYGDNLDEIESKCRSHESVAFDMVVEGKDYYFCSSPLKFNNLSLSFVVEEAYLTEVSGSAFPKVIAAGIAIAVLLVIAMLAISWRIREAQLQNEKIRAATEINKTLEEASQAKSDFLSNMSHDIRTPINGIMGMTTIAKNVPGNPPKTVECLDKIDGASSHLLSLINDVLDMSRIERGKTQIKAESLDIRALCDNCVSIIKGQMNGRELELALETACSHPRIIGDSLHLRQIFINLLGNAVKFTLDGGKITFRAKELESDGTNVVLAFEVEDTGIGMSAEFLPTIFDAFSQEDSRNRTNYKGTGLGMAITKQLTEMMGGTIKVESEVNVGSKFTVTIPFVVDDSEIEEEVNNAVADISGVKILLVEDNDLNMDIATELLSDEGAEITPAQNGQMALDMFSEKPAGTFDIILMDIMMPIMNGYEATEAIRALNREDAKTIPIVAMTANAFDDDIKAAKDAGMNAHLSKPIDIDEVINTVAKFCK